MKITISQKWLDFVAALKPKPLPPLKKCCFTPVHRPVVQRLGFEGNMNSSSPNPVSQLLFERALSRSSSNRLSTLMSTPRLRLKRNRDFENYQYSLRHYNDELSEINTHEPYIKKSLLEIKSSVAKKQRLLKKISRSLPRTTDRSLERFEGEILRLKKLKRLQYTHNSFKSNRN